MTEQNEKSNAAIALEAIKKCIQEAMKKEEAEIKLYEAILKVLTPWKGKKLVGAKIADQLVKELGGSEEATVIAKRTGYSIQLDIWTKTDFRKQGIHVPIAKTHSPKEMKDIGSYYMQYDPQSFERYSGLMEARERNKKRKELLENDQKLLDLIEKITQIQIRKNEIHSIIDDYPDKNMILDRLNFYR